MGTHPIFESDFDCLTESRPKIRIMQIRFNEAIVNVETTDELLNMVPSGEVLSAPIQAGFTLEQKKVKEEVKPEAKKAVKPEETAKEVKEEKSEAEKGAKKSSLKERLQDIAKKAKRAKSYYSTSGWWNRRTTSYPDWHDYRTSRSYNWRHRSTSYPDYDYGRTSQSPSDYNSGYTTDSTCDWSGCYCNWSSDCSGSLMCYDNRCSYRTTTPDYGWNDYTTMGYWDYSTARYVGSEEYRDEEEENERDEERINPRGKDTPDQPKSK